MLQAGDSAAALQRLKDGDEQFLAVGFKCDWDVGRVDQDPSSTYAVMAAVARLRDLCESAAQSLQGSSQTEFRLGIDVEAMEGGFAVHVSPASVDDAHVSSPVWESRTKALATQLYDEAFRPLLEAPLLWTMERTENGALWRRSMDVATIEAGATLPEVEALWKLLATAVSTPQGASTSAQSRCSSIRRVLARQLVPPVLQLVKDHVMRCLPNLHSLQELEAVKQHATSLVLHLHDTLVSLGWVADPALPKAASEHNVPERLSDLPSWVHTMSAICKQHMTGCTLEKARSLALSTSKDSWDLVTTELEQPHRREPVLSAQRSAPATEKRPPSPKSTAPVNPAMDATPKLADSPVISNPSKLEKSGKAKKNALGVVKIGTKLPTMPSSEPSHNSAPELPKPAPKLDDLAHDDGNDDDWDWGDDEPGPDQPTEPELVPVAAAPAPADDPDDDDWGWGDDESMAASPVASPNPATTPGPDRESTAVPVTDTAKTPPSVAQDDMEDAWDWGDDSALTPPPEAARAAAPLNVQAWTVSQRVLSLTEFLDAQWTRIKMDQQARPLFAQGFVESTQVYRALMPVIHAQVLTTVPMLGMLFSNDSTYLSSILRSYADQATQWGAFRLASRQTFEASLRAEADLWNDMATQWREAMLGRQLHTVHECLDQANGFTFTTDPARFETCVRMVSQVEHTLLQLATAWRPILARSELNGAMAQLLDVVFQRVLREIEELQDITEAESEKLAHLCRLLVEVAKKLMNGDEADVPSYFKFAYLPDILQGSLADIEYLLFDNESGNALRDYSRDEMILLVRALFADMPNRRHLLDRLHRW